MGCDIHICVEKKIGDNWVMLGRPGFRSPCEDRNYERFAALAGVRGAGPAPRGLPDDISPATKFWMDKYSDHSCSWLPMEEAAKIFLETSYYAGSKPDGYAQKYPCHHYFEIYDTEDPANYRIVFGFDS